ncbi:MAG: bifunctional indole-3-glycerol-phosphate synthase TrpC/phosphoribosylanthranilate isomerase TrpF [Succinivibrio sp.]
MLHTEELTEKARAYKGLNLESLDGTVLATIINSKVNDVDNIDISGTRSAPRRSLFAALSPKNSRNFILECKKSSPTLGDFCKDFNLDRLISCYEKRAAAISVLCEEHYFKGSLSYLKYVKDHCSLPVICKDFIICEKQIDAANIAGADAVLLMLSVLTHERFLELYNYAKQKQLDVLTEVDSLEDAEFVISQNIDIAGINNRDLRTLTIDLDKAKKLYPLFSDKVRVVSESGIKEHSDLVYLNPIKNFLIGSSITAQNDVVFKANSMLYGLNKICGITTREALEAAIDVHASVAGFIFAEKSPRCVTVDKVLELTKGLDGEIRYALVFVDEDVETMAEAAKMTHASYIQLHGSETLDTVLALKKALPDIGIIKAFNIRSKDDFAKVNEYLKVCDLAILDSSMPGSGNSFNWDEIPADLDKSKILLSGGIGADNAHKALGYGFAGLDLNSKLEKSKGIKDVELIKKAFEIINNY